MPVGERALISGENKTKTLWKVMILKNSKKNQVGKEQEGKKWRIVDSGGDGTTSTSSIFYPSVQETADWDEKAPKKEEENKNKNKKKKGKLGGAHEEYEERLKEVCD